jgi:hypothetical protein
MHFSNCDGCRHYTIYPCVSRLLNFQRVHRVSRVKVSEYISIVFFSNSARDTISEKIDGHLLSYVGTSDGYSLMPRITLVDHVWLETSFEFKISTF